MLLLQRLSGIPLLLFQFISFKMHLVFFRVLHGAKQRFSLNDAYFFRFFFQ